MDYTERVETRVKERLTGALILVALLVIVVPEMLSGPDTPPASPSDAQGESDGPPLRSYTMDLGDAQSDQSALVPQAPTPAAGDDDPQGEVASAAPASQPRSVPPPPPAPAAPPVTPPEPAPAVAAPAPAVAAAPAGGSDAWWVQIGSFSQTANAERVVKQLDGAGIAARISSVRSNGKELFRVRAGPVADRAAAEQLRGRLAAAGHKGTLVAP